MSIAYSSYEDVERAERIFYINYLRPGMVAFDVGANVGDLTLMFARLVGRSGAIHAFEPTPQTFERLETLCRAAALPNVCLNAIALSESTGEISFNIYQTDYCEWNTRANRPLAEYGISVAAPATISVPCETVDDYCERNGIDHIDLLKIDVEGAELEVMFGAERLLRDQRIRLLTFEFGQTTFDMGHKPADIIALMDRYGYQVRNLVANDPAFPGGHSVQTANFSMHVAQPASHTEP